MGAEGRTGITGPADASLDVLTQSNNQLTRDINDLKAAQRTDRRRALTVITPGAPFIIAQKVVAKGIEVTCQIELPPASTIEFITAIYRAADDPLDNTKEQRWEDIPQADVDNAHFEAPFHKALDPSTDWVLVALIAKGDFPTSRKTRNPDPEDPASSLATWTTIGFFTNDPSKPDIGLLVENKFDEVTKAFDAFVVARVYAPINGNYTAYTGTVTINNTTTVTGTVSFVGQVAIGQLISINSQTRKVTNVSGSTLTVDLPFIGAAGGLELLWGIPHTWESALVNAVIPVLKLTDDAGAKKQNFRHDITDDEQTLNSVDIRIGGLVAARKYDWTQNILVGESGRRHVLAASTQTFIAGGFANATAGIPEITTPSWKYDNQPPYSDQLRNVQLYLTQPNPPVALDRRETHRRLTGTGTIAYTNGVANITGTGTAFLTELAVGNQLVVGAYLAAGYQRMIVASITDDTHATVEASSLPTATASGQAFKVGKILDEVMARRPKFHPVGGGQIKFNLGEIKTKKLANQDFVNVLFAQNGSIREDVDNFTTGSTGEVSADTAAPTLATNPDTGTTGPTVRERHAKLKWFIVLPSANINTLDNYQVVLSTSASAPAGAPTVGSEGVLEIDYGQSGHFNIPYTFDLTTGSLYIYFRAHNEFNGGSYSVWSAGTNQLGYSRPMQDGIDTSVPILSMRLEASGTAPSSPAVANDTTHFSISISDATDYQALLTAGVVLHLNIPSPGTGGSAAADTTRKATAYDTVNHRFTVDVAFSAGLGNSLAYEIHRGNALGEKSGTGHSTTTIHLGTAGALLADGALNGYSVYAPSQPAADQIRKITSHSGGVITLDAAVTAALANNACYLICQGTFGYAAVHPESGIIAAVPWRIWLKTDVTPNQTVHEVIMPTGDGSFSIQGIQIEAYRNSTGAQRVVFTGNPSVLPQFYFSAPGALFLWRFRLQNLYRDGGSDGFSAWTSYVEGYFDTSGGGTPPGIVYTPGTYVPIEIDFQDPDNYPIGRFEPL